VEELESLVRQNLHIRKHAEEDHAPLEHEFDEELNRGTTPRSQWAICLQWLILLRGLDLQWLVDNDYLEDGYKPAPPPLGLLGRWLGGKISKPIRRRSGQRASPSGETDPPATEPAKPAAPAEADKKGARLVSTSGS
jgi:hypothetical protein